MIGIVICAVVMAVIVILYIRYEKWVKVAPPVIVDPERNKCESPIEFRLYDALKANGEYIRTQVKCGRYSIDIALPVYHLAIECDGRAYHSTPEQKAHDKRKDAFLKKNGWKVLRFSGSRITRDLKGILNRIEKEKG